MMAANAANDGSGRCQPKFIDDVNIEKWFSTGCPSVASVLANLVHERGELMMGHHW
jgi:hypothetical protein